LVSILAGQSLFPRSRAGQRKGRQERRKLR
jgi:hypothetical protein